MSSTGHCSLVTCAVTAGKPAQEKAAQDAKVSNASTMQCTYCTWLAAAHQACQQEMRSHDSVGSQVRRIAVGAGTAHQLRSVALSPHRCQMSSMRL